MYTILKLEHRELMNKFKEDIQKWKEKYSKQERLSEVEDLWFEWVSKKLPLGQTAKQYWEDFDKFMS